jgi:phosphoserine aminotransferase
MTTRALNFGAGPATLPVEVLTESQAALLSFAGTGAGVLEISHRSKEWVDYQAETEQRIRRLAGAGDEWAVLFLPGGASLQFHMVPRNLGTGGDYVVTGIWSEKALEEAQRLGPARVAGTSAATAHDRIPAVDARPDAAYLHVTSNNTVYGTQWPDLPASKAPLVVDASSDIFSRPLPLERCALVYAGAQKNLGPAGVTLVLVRRALLERSKGANLPPMLDYAVQAKNDSNYNTCPVFPIYVVGRMTRWLEGQGGLQALEKRNARKAAKVYAAIDGSGGYYRGMARPEARSAMNVTFRLPTPADEERFLVEAARAHMIGLKGHRTVGGLRASLYNACPAEAVDALAAFMSDFARRG